MSHRFYHRDPPREGPFRLGPEESRHLVRVCRLGVGDRVEVFDGYGHSFPAEVVTASAEAAELIPVGERVFERPPPCFLTLATAIPKGDRFDWLVEKATELGVERLIPIVAERSVVVPRGTKLDRLRRTIVEASKQCGRSRLMQLDEPMEWPEVVGAFPVTPRCLMDPRGQPSSRWPAIHYGKPAVLAVGPEGGFTGPEVEAAVEAGWFPIRVGETILRVETAGLAGCAALIARASEGGE